MLSTPETGLVPSGCHKKGRALWLGGARRTEVCDDLLAEDATDAKARLRRGQALMELGECPQSEEGWGAAADIGRDG